MLHIDLKEFNMGKDNKEAYRNYRDKGTMNIIEEKVYSRDYVISTRYLLDKLNDIEKTKIIEEEAEGKNNYWVLVTKEVYNEYTRTCSKEFVELVEVTYE